MNASYDIVILGLSITSSWGNGHATTWRSLVRGLAGLGHNVLFLERDVPWYADNRDDIQPLGATTVLYDSLDDLISLHEQAVRHAGLVIVGSYVPDGIQIGEWVTSVAKGNTAFYDIDTPITVDALADNQSEYITPALIPKYDAYLSFTGGPTLRRLEDEYGSPMARALYCSVDANAYKPLNLIEKWDLGYLGTYSADRQPHLDSLLLKPALLSRAKAFAVAGPQYPSEIDWPENVERMAHLSPDQHAAFYSSQRFTLNITRQAMRKAGFSPSVRLFEAAACGVPIISDWWEGLDSVFKLQTEVLVVQNESDVCRYLHELPDDRRTQIAFAARQRILQEHTSEARARQLESYWKEMNDNLSANQARGHRRFGKDPGWKASGLDLERERTRTGKVFIDDPVGIATSSDLHEPAGADS